MNSPPKIANAFSVDNADAKNPLYQAGFKVIRDQFLDFTRAKRVQIQNAVDGQLNRLIHRRTLPPETVFGSPKTIPLREGRITASPLFHSLRPPSKKN